MMPESKIEFEKASGDKSGEMDEVAALVEKYRLEPIPDEGGWFRRLAEGPADSGGHLAWTSIVALFTRREFSALHRLAVDEVWIPQAGDSLRLTQLERGGGLMESLLGWDDGEEPQARVAAGVWQAACPVGERGWSIVSCVCVPGFSASAFELGRREFLVREFPAHADLIGRLTRD